MSEVTTTRAPSLMLVGGKLRPAQDGATYPTYSPSTGQLLADVPSAGAADVDVAVAAAEQAFASWRTVPPRQRATLLRTIAGVLRDNRAELARLDALDCGNPITAMRGDVDLAAELLESCADWVGALGGDAPASDGNHLHYTVRQPFGVVARIVPYNHPLMFAASKLAAPLLAGNTVILKAPDQAPLSTLRLGELLADVVPPGVVSFISGIGSVVGPHPYPDMVTRFQSVISEEIKKQLIEKEGNPFFAFAFVFCIQHPGCFFQHE